MSKAKLRELSDEEFALVCGGFWGDSIGTLPPVYAEPPPVYEYPEWPDYGPPDWYDPYDPYPDGGGGGGGGGGSNPLDAFTTSGLGAAVDDLINKSATLEGLVILAQNKGFTIVPTNGHSNTNLDPNSKIIEVKTYGNAADTVAQLTHELGHSLFDREWTRSMSWDAAVKMGLATEGEATLYSIAVQRELSAQGISMSLAGEKANASTYDSIYNSYAAGQISWDAAAAQIGEIYRHGERIDINGTVTKADDITYEQYYSNWWNSMQSTPPSPAPGGGNGGGGGGFPIQQR